MKAARIKKINKEKEKLIQEEYSIKKLLILIILITAVFFLFYFITTLLVKPTLEKNDSVEQADSSEISLNHLLDKEETEYYVIAIENNIKSSSLTNVNYAELYNKYINDYNVKDDALKFYTIDLNASINKKYLDENMNITNNLSELKLNDETLFKINNGKISEYYVGKTEIIKVLSNL